MAVVLVTVPSPKSQNRFVMVPAEASLKKTVSGYAPMVGLPLKLADTACAPLPVTGFVLVPPLLLAISTTLL